MTVGVRLVARVVEAVESIERRRPVGVAVAVVSAAADVRLISRLRDPAWWPGWQQWFADGADVAARSLLSGDGSVALPAFVADVVPTGVMAGFEVSAGTLARPAPPRSTAWPPHGIREVVRSAGRAAGPFAFAAAGHVVGERLRGRRARLRDFAQVSVVSTGLSVLAARHRERLHRQAIDRYRARIGDHSERWRQIAVVNARTAPNPGHDFAKTLVVLGELGDELCAAAGQRALDTPRRLLEDRADGATLRSLLGDLPVEPPDAGRLWVPADQVPVLQQQLATAETVAVDGIGQAVTVVEVTARRTVLRWLGSEVVIETDPPSLADRFYPTTMGFALGANYKLLPALASIPLTRVVAGAGIDAVAAWRHRNPRIDDNAWSPLIWSTLATVTQTLCVARNMPHARSRIGPPVSATASCTGAALIWASNWGRLNTRQRALAAVPIACWAYAMAKARPLSRHRWLIEAAYLAMPAIAVWRLTDRLDEEADLVAQRLVGELDTEERAAERSAVVEVIKEYQQALELAREGIRRLDEKIPSPLRDHVEADCVELEAWLAATEQSVTA